MNLLYNYIFVGLFKFQIDCRSFLNYHLVYIVAFKNRSMKKNTLTKDFLNDHYLNYL